MKRSLVVSMVFALVGAWAFSCGDETTLGSCIVLDTSINDDLCTNEWDDQCTGNQAEWVPGTCQENELTKACDNGTFVEDGVLCPGEEEVAAESCVFMNEDFGDEFCLEEDAEDCVELGGEMEAGTCEALGFTVVCLDLRVEDGVECPSMDIGVCMLITAEYDVCMAEEEYDCYFSGGEWDGELSCEDLAYDVDCGNDMWVSDGDTCPDELK